MSDFGVQVIIFWLKNTENMLYTWDKNEMKLVCVWKKIDKNSLIGKVF